MPDASGCSTVVLCHRDTQRRRALELQVDRRHHGGTRVKQALGESVAGEEHELVVHDPEGEVLSFSLRFQEHSQTRVASSPTAVTQRHKVGVGIVLLGDHELVEVARHGVLEEGVDSTREVKRSRHDQRILTSTKAKVLLATRQIDLEGRLGDRLALGHAHVLAQLLAHGRSGSGNPTKMLTCQDIIGLLLQVAREELRRQRPHVVPDVKGQHCTRCRLEPIALVELRRLVQQLQQVRGRCGCGGPVDVRVRVGQQARPHTPRAKGCQALVRQLVVLQPPLMSGLLLLRPSPRCTGASAKNPGERGLRVLVGHSLVAHGVPGKQGPLRLALAGLRPHLQAEPLRVLPHVLALGEVVAAAFEVGLHLGTQKSHGHPCLGCDPAALRRVEGIVVRAVHPLHVGDADLPVLAPSSQKTKDCRGRQATRPLCPLAQPQREVLVQAALVDREELPADVVALRSSEEARHYQPQQLVGPAAEDTQPVVGRGRELHDDGPQAGEAHRSVQRVRDVEAPQQRTGQVVPEHGGKANLCFANRVEMRLRHDVQEQLALHVQVQQLQNQGVDGLRRHRGDNRSSDIRILLEERGGLLHPAPELLREVLRAHSRIVQVCIAIVAVQDVPHAEPSSGWPQGGPPSEVRGSRNVREDHPQHDLRDGFHRACSGATARTRPARAVVGDAVVTPVARQHLVHEVDLRLQRRLPVRRNQDATALVHLPPPDDMVHQQALVNSVRRVLGRWVKSRQEVELVLDDLDQGLLQDLLPAGDVEDVGHTEEVLDHPLPLEHTDHCSKALVDQAPLRPVEDVGGVQRLPDVVHGLPVGSGTVGTVDQQDEVLLHLPQVV
eukprot:7226125-Lingulodinium_polyedra.AAC.1